MCSEGCFGLQLDPEKLRLEEDGESESICPSEELALAFRSAPRQAVGQEKEDVLQHYSECLSMCVAELEALQGKLGKHASTACHDIPRTEEIEGLLNVKYDELCEWFAPQIGDLNSALVR